MRYGMPIPRLVGYTRPRGSRKPAWGPYLSEPVRMPRRNIFFAHIRRGDREMNRMPIASFWVDYFLWHQNFLMGYIGSIRSATHTCSGLLAWHCCAWERCLWLMPCAPYNTAWQVHPLTHHIVYQLVRWKVTDCRYVYTWHSAKISVRNGPSSWLN